MSIPSALNPPRVSEEALQGPLLRTGRDVDSDNDNVEENSFIPLLLIPNNNFLTENKPHSSIEDLSERLLFTFAFNETNKNKTKTTRRVLGRRSIPPPSVQFREILSRRISCRVHHEDTLLDLLLPPSFKGSFHTPLPPPPVPHSVLQSSKSFISLSLFPIPYFPFLFIVFV